MEQSQTVESKKVNYDDVLTFSVRLTPEEWKALLPPHVDPKDYAAAEKYIRDLLQSIVDSTPPHATPPGARQQRMTRFSTLDKKRPSPLTDDGLFMK